MSASPILGVPSQPPHPYNTNAEAHEHDHDHAHHHHHHHTSQQQRQPLPSASRRPTAAALRRDKIASGRGAGGLMRLEIYMDLLCPWCFIEKHSLEALMARYAQEHPDVRFEVTWKPYYIAPTMGKSTFFILLFIPIRPPLSTPLTNHHLQITLIYQVLTNTYRRHRKARHLRAPRPAQPQLPVAHPGHRRKIRHRLLHPRHDGQPAHGAQPHRAGAGGARAAGPGARRRAALPGPL